MDLLCLQLQGGHQTVGLLCVGGADASKMDSRGQNALHLAVRLGQERSTNALLEFSGEGNFVLITKSDYFACQKGYTLLDLILLFFFQLLDILDVDVSARVFDLYDSPLLVAIQENKPSIAEKLRKLFYSRGVI